MRPDAILPTQYFSRFRDEMVKCRWGGCWHAVGEVRLVDYGLMYCGVEE